MRKAIFLIMAMVIGTIAAAQEPGARRGSGIPLYDNTGKTLQHEETVLDIHPAPVGVGEVRSTTVVSQNLVLVRENGGKFDAPLNVVGIKWDTLHLPSEIYLTDEGVPVIAGVTIPAPEYYVKYKTFSRVNLEDLSAADYQYFDQVVSEDIDRLTKWVQIIRTAIVRTSSLLEKSLTLSQQVKEAGAIELEDTIAALNYFKAEILRYLKDVQEVYASNLESAKLAKANAIKLRAIYLDLKLDPGPTPRPSRGSVLDDSIRFGREILDK
jgi:hypothetical protein